MVTKYLTQWFEMFSVPDRYGTKKEGDALREKDHRRELSESVDPTELLGAEYALRP